ncbi:MAG: GDP-mannose 4,6-dehydratase [Desulforhabdus sp.]|jgi:GDPmannose 4,6-dehydratase|nr:GDP-mannose 4,6-dehydratase [Desulforhabdus sp.]
MSLGSRSKKALITGVAGQDGSYLAEVLVRDGYEVHGVDLPHVLSSEIVPPNLTAVANRITLHPCTLVDSERIAEIVAFVCPDECFHVGAASFVSYAFAQESLILTSNLTGTHNLLAAIKQHASACRIFFAGTSEMFGLAANEPQNEDSPFRPRSVYGISKLAGYHLMNYYRREHGLFTCTGILYNHESPRRGPNFVTRKITMAVARINAGMDHEVRLGNLDAQRDWGYAPDYVNAMLAMVRAKNAGDYVIASGAVHTVRDFVEVAFGHVGLDYRKYVVVDPAFYREAEPVTLRGDITRINKELNWSPQTVFGDLVVEMVEHDLSLVVNPTLY